MVGFIVLFPCDYVISAGALAPPSVPLSVQGILIQATTPRHLPGTNARLLPCFFRGRTGQGNLPDPKGREKRKKERETTDKNKHFSCVTNLVMIKLKNNIIRI